MIKKKKNKKKQKQPGEPLPRGCRNSRSDCMETTHGKEGAGSSQRWACCKKYSKKANDAVNRRHGLGRAARNRKRLNDRVKAEAKIMKDRVEAIGARTTGRGTS